MSNVIPEGGWKAYSRKWKDKKYLHSYLSDDRGRMQGELENEEAWRGGVRGGGWGG